MAFGVISGWETWLWSLSTCGTIGKFLNFSQPPDSHRLCTFVTLEADNLGRYKSSIIPRVGLSKDGKEKKINENMEF